VCKQTAGNVAGVFEKVTAECAESTSFSNNEFQTLVARLEE